MQYACKPLYHISHMYDRTKLRDENSDRLVHNRLRNSSSSFCQQSSSFLAIAIQLTPAIFTISSLHRFFGLPRPRFPILGCHSVTLLAQRSSSILAILCAQRHFRCRYSRTTSLPRQLAKPIVRFPLSKTDSGHNSFHPSLCKS